MPDQLTSNLPDTPTGIVSGGLLACPFCGAVPTLTYEKWMDLWTAECPTSERLCVKPMTCDYKREVVVERWNRRMVPLRWPTRAELKSERERTLQQIHDWKTGEYSSPGQMAVSERHALAMRCNIQALDKRLEIINDLLGQANDRTKPRRNNL
jgi:hypothetical protein